MVVDEGFQVKMTQFFMDSELARRSLSTALLFFVLFFIRFIALRSITNSTTIPKEFRRQWIVKTKGISLLLFTIGIVVIWASELRSFAISLVAIAAAIVIGLKEILMNMSGSFVRASSKLFSIGDRIEVNGVRGDVIDHTLFVTTLFEIGPGHLTNQYTGRSVSVPNSVFLNQNVINESFTEKYMLHVFKLPAPISKDLEELRQYLLKVTTDYCQSYLQDARVYFENFGRKLGIDTPSVDPRVLLTCAEAGYVEFVVRFPTTPDQRLRAEQEILSKVLHEKSDLIALPANSAAASKR